MGGMLVRGAPLDGCGVGEGTTNSPCLVRSQMQEKKERLMPDEESEPAAPTPRVQVTYVVEIGIRSTRGTR